jgi:hypothetical protein
MMARPVAPPDDRTLLPQLLACLPGSTAPNSQPPPALLPLLSPILRQRVQLLSSPSAGQDSWLPLLCWDRQRAAQIPPIVDRLDIEPHPVSGEIEPPEVESISYRRIDQETLHARLPIREIGLLPIYLWCTGDAQGGGDGWRLTELRPLDDEPAEDSQNPWVDSIARADEQLSHGSTSTAGLTPQPQGMTNGVVDDDDDDDGSYWAMYDRTPGRTPKRPSPAPGPTDSAVHLPNSSELAYFARYAAEVQPAMDPHDPAEEQPGTTSTLGGDTLGLHSYGGAPAANANQTSDLQADTEMESAPPPDQSQETTELNQPRPNSPSDSSTTNSIDRLERAAAKQSHAEVGVKQHISTSIKSLYRLAIAAGIERPEFERIVRTELDVLSMMSLEDD